MACRFGMQVYALMCVTWALHRPADVLAAGTLSWDAYPGYRAAAVHVTTNGHAGFSLLAASETKINFTNQLSDAAVAANRLLEIGSGVALGDIDGDGWVDIYFCRIDGENVLYRNLGDWKFEDITASAGVSCPGQHSTGCVLADLDGDGDLDLLVNSLGGGTQAFINDGHGHFSPLAASGLHHGFGATSMALADVDGDGDLDLYVTNYRTDTFQDRISGLKITTRKLPDGREIVEPAERFVGIPNRSGSVQIIERGEPHILYINKGGGHFVPIPWDTGIFLDETGRPLSLPPTDWGLSVMFRDMNGDGLPDLYVCNDFVSWPDRIWWNQSGRKFRAAPKTSFRCVSLSSMAVDVADINRDGFDDIFVAEMLNPHRQARAWQRPDTLSGTVDWPIGNPDFRPEVTRNTLHLARGDGSFAEIAQLAGLAATDWTWSAAFLDVDLDGWEDLLVTTGNNHDVQDLDASSATAGTADWKSNASRRSQLEKIPRRETRSSVFRNRHDLTFEDMSTAWGFNAVGIAHGMALADLDNDGDLDVVINCLNAPARIYRNESPAPRIAVRLKGSQENTRGIGAKIKITGGPVTQTQEMIAGGRYCSSDDAMRVFAAGQSRELQIEITWRNGRRSLVTNATPNKVYEISEAEAGLPPPAPAPESRRLFEDISGKLNHTHTGSEFDDFARQPLLPRRLSTLGPGVAWFDLDRSGRDGLVITGGRESRARVYLPSTDGTLKEWENPPFPKSNQRSQTSVLGWHDSANRPHLLVGESTWETAETNSPAFQEYCLMPPAGVDSSKLPQSASSSTGPMALADVDGDGSLELFVGGTSVPGRYPEPADSHLFRNRSGIWEVAQDFPKLGLVNAAVFFDYDDDGDPDLALATDWGSLRLFRNDHGHFTEVTSEMSLASLKGFWNGLAVGDFDGDGRLDLVASNWGQNWRPDPAASRGRSVQIYFGEFAEDGVTHPLVASVDPDLGAITPWRDRNAVSKALPTIPVRFPMYHDYGKASIKQVLGDRNSTAGRLEISTTESTIFLNRGHQFESHALPIEAQFAPAFGISVADFDGDGNEDVFLAQNFFGVDEDSSRSDAGVGQLLLGDGKGGFRSLSSRESGISMYGEQRASAVADFDGDGRVDLVVTQYGGTTHLYRNAMGQNGVRVRLQGPSQNPDAIGAKVRLRFSDRVSPVREIHAGSGHWSQDSFTLVFGGSTSPNTLEVTWPGGHRQTWPWPDQARAVVVSDTGIKIWKVPVPNP
jgi:hypothetical protein